ncbi:MAG: KilA-N domain-containing protein [Methylorubrum rhodinum]|uniref:KilA-N domain-containing protein n=1 Tax=Methylorubrum rhodinum TaxID=29428 RepID=UPI003BB04DD9
MSKDGDDETSPLGSETTTRGLPALVYKGEIIHERHEMLSLTDMWKAEGADPSRKPAEWARSADAKRFIEYVGLTLNVGNSHLLKGASGRGGSTLAHWQVALAYAKYLSPEFHMWCNTVVRERMEGAPPAALSSEVVELIRRTDGIARMLSGKVTSMQARVEALEEKNAVPSLDFGGTVSAYEMIAMAGIAPEDRQRGTAQMVTRCMISFCAERQVACFRTPAEVNPSRPFRFPKPLASEWLLGERRGLERIRSQVGRMRAKKESLRRGSRQTSLQLVSPTPPDLGRPL